MDFAQAPMLRTLPDGRNLLVVGQKDGHAWGLDPDKQGAVVWSRQVGLGLDGGGGGALMWGAASDDRAGVFSDHAREQAARPDRSEHGHRRDRLARVAA